MNRTFLCSILTTIVSTHAQAKFLINEVDSDNSGSDTAEFIELYDGGVGNQSLNGYSLVFYNGAVGTSYQSYSLDGMTTNEDGFLVLCGDKDNVKYCDQQVQPASNLIQNGADAVALYFDSVDKFPLSSPISDNNLIDALVYDTNDSDNLELLALLNPNQPQVNEGESGSKDLHSNQRCDNIALNTDGYRQNLPTPGTANNCGEDGESDPIVELGSCGATLTKGFKYIHQVQGKVVDPNVDSSPLLGESVIVEGIVVADLQGGILPNGDNSFQYSGFWLQEEDRDQDSDLDTSEGIFVYHFKDDVEVGDQIRLLAKVDEYNQVTQLKSVQSITVCDQEQPLPSVTPVTMPVESLAQWEALEGMRVEATENLVVSDLFGTGYGFGNYGQFVVSSRLHFQPTEIALPMSDEAQQAYDNFLLDRLLVDDGVSASFPGFIPFPDETGFSAQNPMRIGYEVPKLIGIMHGYKNNYTLIPSEIIIDPVNERSHEPYVAPDANLIIASMNVLNYFNGDGLGGGFPTSRGAPTLDAFEMQSEKIVAAITAMNADVIGLMEIENDGYGELSAISELVRRLNKKQLKGEEYAFVIPEQTLLGNDEISVGILYRQDKLMSIGDARILDSTNSPLDEAGNVLFDDTKNRPVLIQRFEFKGNIFTVAVNHLKSKGSACNEMYEGQDGQGNCNVSRTRAVQALTQYLSTKPTGQEQETGIIEDIMIMGDLNAYSKEDPMQHLYKEGYANVKYTDASTEQKPFSFTFSGLLGSLDHILTNESMKDKVLSVDAWHINSVEAPLMDYLTEENGQYYDSVDHYAAPDAFRSSDHDPIIVALNYEECGSLYWLLLILLPLGYRKSSTCAKSL